jgi:aryl-alcohol dehydrogenase-like predicted oxidoreductase
VTIQLPTLSFGAMTFGDQVDQATAQRMVRRALDAGVTLFDTADSYHEGASETILGRCLEGIRDQVLVASKVGRPVGGDPQRSGLSPAWIRSSVDGSLKRLGIDHLDLYYLHLPDPQTPFEATLEVMDELVEVGKIRAVAVSNHAAWQLADLRALATARGWAAPAVSQVLYNVISRRLEDEYVAFAAAHGMVTTVYNPLAGGLLTGKHRRDAVPAEGRFALDRYRDRYWDAARFEAVEALQQVADDAGIGLLELAFRWLRSQDVVDSILLGASREDQLEANLAACAGGPLPDEVLKACDEVWRRVGGSAPRYNR